MVAFTQISSLENFFMLKLVVQLKEGTVRLNQVLWTIMSLIILTSACSFLDTHNYDFPKSQYRKLDMTNISIGMTEEEVQKVLGEPVEVIGFRFYESWHNIRVLQYLEVWRRFSWSSLPDCVKKNFYLYFFDNRLVKWGHPGDWKKEADQIYESKIR